ncbi:trypsin-like serine protease [Micromonospora sp. LOL_021]|uniref:trypsin-like serine protease n=1 Tax=Micromonospora sp. LOL_021 TaxID=3345417 RepID=UPI003A83D1AA
MEIVDAISNLGIELGVDADVWVEQHDGAQELKVRTARKDIAAALGGLSLSGSTSVTVVDEPTIASRRLVVTDEVAESVRAVSPGVQGLYVRTADGALVVDTTDTAAKADVAALQRATGFAKIEVTRVEPAGDTAILVRGGVALGGCTAGFSATYGSYKGYFTAGHCGSSQVTYSNTAGTGSWVTGTKRIQAYNTNSDIAFFSIPSDNYISSTFFGSSSSSATSVGFPADVPEGITACHRGKAVGWGCGTITSIAYQPTWSGACPGGTCNAVFVRVGTGTAAGDSGGPWVNGNRPIGIHKGGGSSYSVYSKIYRIPAGTSIY